MASARSKGREVTKKILIELSDAGGSVVESSLNPYGKLRIANIFVEGGKVQRTQMRKKLLALASQGLISVKEKKSEISISLLPPGEIQALKYKIDDIAITRQDWWDRKWRMILFDVPEEHRVLRSNFRNKLDDLGFVKLQNSVYVHPFECHNEIDFIRNVYGIKQYVKIVIVDKIEGESQLRKQFNL